MKIFNSIYLIGLAIFIFILSSVLWIGSYDTAQKLKENIFVSYFLRFLGFSIIGMIGILFLILINWIRNTITSSNKIDIQSLFLHGIIYISISSLIGVLLFFIIL